MNALKRIAAALERLADHVETRDVVTVDLTPYQEFGRASARTFDDLPLARYTGHDINAGGNCRKPGCDYHTDTNPEHTP